MVAMAVNLLIKALGAQDETLQWRLVIMLEYNTD